MKSTDILKSFYPLSFPEDRVLELFDSHEGHPPTFAPHGTRLDPASDTIRRSPSFLYACCNQGAATPPGNSHPLMNTMGLRIPLWRVDGPRAENLKVFSMRIKCVATRVLSFPRARGSDYPMCLKCLFDDSFPSHLFPYDPYRFIIRIAGSPLMFLRLDISVMANIEHLSPLGHPRVFNC